MFRILKEKRKRLREQSVAKLGITSAKRAHIEPSAAKHARTCTLIDMSQMEDVGFQWLEAEITPTPTPTPTTPRKILVEKAPQQNVVETTSGQNEVVPFEQRIEQLKAFKESHGHVRVTQKYDIKLADFCSNLRAARRDPEKRSLMVTEAWIKTLDALGFEWNAIRGHSRVHADSYDDRIEQLKAFKEKHGHIDIRKDQDVKLANLCYLLRGARRNPEKYSIKLTEARIKTLDALGFIWDVVGRTESYDDRIEQLKGFKEKHGHLRITLKHDKKLAEFCYHVRGARRNPEKYCLKITEAKIKTLDELGFDWKTGSKVHFEERVEQLKAYKKIHGHVNVKATDDKNLYYFCQNIKRSRRQPGNGGLVFTDERSKALEELGFEWGLEATPKQVSFEECVEQLKAYKKIHGHVNVKVADDKHLHLFCSIIKKDHQQPGTGGLAFTDERIKALNELGLKCDLEVAPKRAKQMSFELRVEQLKAFKRIHGHVHVKATDDKNLYSFVKKTRSARRNKMTLAEEKINALDELGFEWRPLEAKSQAKQVSFEDCVEQLKEFKETHGHVHVKNADDKNLSQFCQDIRSGRQKPGTGISITVERSKALDELGFEWDLEATANKVLFEQRIEELKVYKEIHGHVNVKPGHDLSDFCNNIRGARRHPNKPGTGGLAITEERIKALDKLGFKWVLEATPKLSAKRVCFSFEQRIKQLKAYKEIHGHVYVKRGHDQNLSTFCRHIRSARRTPRIGGLAITEEKIKALDELGFAWVSKATPKRP